MHYTIKMKKGDHLVSTTGYFPDAETALTDGSQYLIEIYGLDDKDWDIEVAPNPEAAAEEEALIDRIVDNNLNFYKLTGRWPE